LPARQPEREAERLLSRFGMAAAPIDVAEIAGRLDVRISEQDLDPSVSGLLIRDDDRVILGVNRRQPRQRRRFTIAHELGHLAMHKGRPILLDTSMRVNFRDQTAETATDREEIEANGFAAALLMPVSLVRSHLVESVAGAGGEMAYDALLDTLRKGFDVSREAMALRLMNLGFGRTS